MKEEIKCQRSEINKIHAENWLASQPATLMDIKKLEMQIEELMMIIKTMKQDEK